MAHTDTQTHTVSKALESVEACLHHFVFSCSNVGLKMPNGRRPRKSGKGTPENELSLAEALWAREARGVPTHGTQPRAKGNLWRGTGVPANATLGTTCIHFFPGV